MKNTPRIWVRPGMEWLGELLVDAVQAAAITAADELDDETTHGADPYELWRQRNAAFIEQRTAGNVVPFKPSK